LGEWDPPKKNKIVPRSIDTRWIARCEVRFGNSLQESALAGSGFSPYIWK
jgi:hypothetical protein